MSCRKYRELLTPYLDKELPDREHQEVEAHLNECEQCRSKAREMNRSLEMFKAVGRAEPMPELNPYLAERIAARAMEERLSRQTWRARMGFAFGALTLVAGLFIGLLLNPYINGQPQQDNEVRLTSISFQSEGIGVEIDQDNFIIHSKDRNGEKGVDLKL